MTEDEFKRILLQPESSTLDFKKELYDFTNDIENKKTAAFIKDIVSFANTIRTVSGYIVIGVKVLEDGTKCHIGLNSHIDDSILQEKLKSKVHPIPKFSYSTINYNNLTFGIIEIPVTKYPAPISAITKLKGLDPGKFYFRRGSSNSEANGLECINISQWLESLPDIGNEESLFDETSKILSKLTNPNSRLSECFLEALNLAIKYKVDSLKHFCSFELSGWSKDIISDNEYTSFNYRTNKAIFTPLEIEIPPFFGADSSTLIKEIKKIDGVFEHQLFFSQSIVKIEEILSRFSNSNSTICTIKLSNTSFLGDEKFRDLEFTAYCTKDNFSNVYSNIRQKLIDNLIGLT